MESLVVGVIGSGLMGAGVAEIVARSGHQAVLLSRTLDGSDAARSQLVARLDREVGRGRLEERERDETLDRLSTACEIERLSGCDLVIESVIEDLVVKRGLLAEVDRVVGPDTVIASNTSTLPIVELAMATRSPERVCGMHFFNPAPSMPLVEIGRPITASDPTIARAVAFAQSCGKEPIVVADRAGFIVNALLFPYLNGAIRMWEHGTASMEAIDLAMRGGCSYPIGPFALLDLVGLDTSLAILDALYLEFRQEAFVACTTLRRKVAARQLGRKTGIGFYEYSAV